MLATLQPKPRDDRESIAAPEPAQPELRGDGARAGIPTFMRPFVAPSPDREEAKDTSGSEKNPDKRYRRPLPKPKRADSGSSQPADESPDALALALSPAIGIPLPDAALWSARIGADVSLARL